MHHNLKYYYLILVCNSLLIADELPLFKVAAATFALISADDIRLAERLFCEASDCTTPGEAFMDWRRAI